MSWDAEIACGVDSMCIIDGGGCVSELLLTALFVISLFVKKTISCYGSSV